MLVKKINENFLNFTISFLSIFLNTIFAIIQVIFGLLSNSISILVDAVDSMRDILTSAVVVISLYISKKPADRIHPFGHGRVEDIGGLILSIFLFLLGFNFLKDSVLRIFNPQNVIITSFIIKTMFFIAIFKLFLGIAAYLISLTTNSTIIKAESLHHYADSFSTFAVTGGLLFVKKGGFYLYLDAILGILISFVILFWSFKMAKGFIDNLIGKEVSASLYEQVKKIAFLHSEVKGVHDIEVHTYGKNKIILLHIEMLPSLSLEEAHNIADSIEKKIYAQNLGRCIVHVDLQSDYKIADKNKIETIIKNIISFTKNIKDFHGVEIITKGNTSFLNFHLLLDKNTSLSESHSISHRLSNILKKKFNFSQVNIHIEPYTTSKENY
ncbi:MAG: cation-efflux pump [Candidatus Omnitrophica bacterium]|nr:cation-efflux pump [Candidatus Omnitrophota bacterium]